MLSDQEVRREIWQTAMQKENNFASYMAGFLVLAGSISLGKNPTVGLAFCHTESGLLAAALLQKMYGYHPEISLDATRKTHRYTIDLPASVSDKLLADCHMRHLDKQGAVCYTLSLGSMRWANTAAFCAALCIEGGKLYTSGEYRLDMVLPADNKRLNELEAALAKKSIKFLYKLSAERLRLSFRKEDIASFLALVGAPETTFMVQSLQAVEFPNSAWHLVPITLSRERPNAFSAARFIQTMVCSESWMIMMSSTMSRIMFMSFSV